MFSDDFPMMLEREAGMPDHVPQLAVAFGLYPLEDQDATAAAGHPVYKDTEFVKIVVPGDKNSLLLQPATEVYRRRFPRAYQAFKERETTPVTGMPIEQWPRISRGLAWTLKAAHIHTVEMLAEVQDTNLDKLPTEVRQLRAEAQATLKQAADTAAVQKLAAEKQQQADMITDLQNQIRQLAARLEAQGEDGAAGPGPASRPASQVAAKPRKAA